MEHVTVQATPPSLISGLRPVDRGFESWWVRPGSATAAELRAGDRVTIRDPDGGQPAEVTVVPDALGLRMDAPATVLGGQLESGEGDGFLGQLHSRGLTPDGARAALLFGADSPPGAAEPFDVERDALLVVAAPAGRLVDGDPPASALVIEIKRHSPRKPSDVPLPEPLAEPRLDFRVDRASALSYEVKEGEYIQVIDVQGRQCSDFLAFHRAKLDLSLIHI